MDYIQEPIEENGICKRCGRKTRILSNGYCTRCDDVLYGHKQQQDYSPWYPKQIPDAPYKPYPDFPRRKQYWCLSEKI